MSVRTRLKRYPRRLPLWVIPLVYVAVTVTCALVLPRLEYAYLANFTHSLSVGSAVAVLSAVASGMIALTGVVYALAFVMVQFSAVAYSPRLVAWYGRDPFLFHSLGLFTATFIYALAGISWIDRAGNGKVPLFSTLAVIVLLVLSMMAFARLVSRLEELQIGSVLSAVGRRGREVIEEMFPLIDSPEATVRRTWASAVADAERAPVVQVLQYADEPWTVARFDLEALVREARAADAVIVVECAVGDALMAGTSLLRVHGRQQIPEDRLRKAIEVARERTFEQDPKYPFRLLVDIAIKALSPAVNDPTTAVQAIDQIEDLLRRLGHRVLDAGWVNDQQGALRVVFPTPTWDDYLRLAFDEIRQFGATSVQVMRRQRAALTGLSEFLADPERRDVVQRYISHLNLTVEHSELDADDQRMALQEDRQGLGLSRHSVDAATSAARPVTD